MHPDLLDILSRKESPITNEQLVNYLTGKMSDEERHELEKTIADAGLDNDAFEGLHLVENKNRLQQYQLDINKALHEKLKQKKPKRRQIKLLQLPWLLLLTGGLLALIFFVWFMLHLLQGRV